MNRKRVPIQLKGSDEQYFRTREIQARPEPEAVPEPVVGAPGARTDGQGARRASPAVPAQVPEPPATEAEVISRIVPLGRSLSTRLQDLAGQIGVPVDDLLYAARKKAVARFRQAIAGPDKPQIPKPEKGGETIRISFKLSAAEMARLTAWFDPLGIGMATRMVAPLLAQALRAEVAAICEGMS